MGWEKSPAWLVDAFGEIVQRRKMFGYPCAFGCGYMFMGLHEDRLVLRLPEDEKTAFREEVGAEPFLPFPNREMREYSVVPESMIREKRNELGSWIRKSLEYVASLPSKK